MPKAGPRGREIAEATSKAARNSGTLRKNQQGYRESLMWRPRPRELAAARDYPAYCAEFAEAPRVFPGNTERIAARSREAKAAAEASRKAPEEAMRRAEEISREVNAVTEESVRLVQAASEASIKASEDAKNKVSTVGEESRQRADASARAFQEYGYPR